MKNRSLLARSVQMGLIVTSLLLFARSGLADVRPLSDELNASGAPVYSSLAQANHVFGFSFRVQQNGFIKKLGGHFADDKPVIIVNGANEIIASATVSGNGSGFSWSTLDTPLAVEPGQSYKVLTRVGVDKTSAAVWSVNMPFLRGDVQVESLEQGWSYETDASA